MKLGDQAGNGCAGSKAPGEKWASGLFQNLVFETQHLNSSLSLPSFLQTYPFCAYLTG